MGKVLPLRLLLDPLFIKCVPKPIVRENERFAMSQVHQHLQSCEVQLNQNQMETGNKELNILFCANQQFHIYTNVFVLLVCFFE